MHASPAGLLKSAARSAGSGEVTGRAWWCGSGRHRGSSAGSHPVVWVGGAVGGVDLGGDGPVGAVGRQVVALGVVRPPAANPLFGRGRAGETGPAGGRLVLAQPPAGGGER